MEKVLCHGVVAEVFDSGKWRPVPLMEAAELVAPNAAASLKGCLGRLRDSGFPVIGVCGTINAGKSTLVSSFLTETGAGRVLQGDDSTERFTFWLPGRPGDDRPEVAQLLESVRSTLGCDLENLSEKPERARDQQNAIGKASKVSQLGTPLIAFDEALADRSIGFLDCPDVQKSADESISEESADLRLEALQRFSRLCSAFIVVTTDQGIKDVRLGKILKKLEATGQKLPLIFVYNMLHPGADPQRKLETVYEVVGSPDQESRLFGVFGAEFDGRDSPRPTFFELGNKDHRLDDLVAGLEASVLREKVHESALAEMASAVSDLADELADREKALSATVAQVHKATTRFLSKNFIDDKKNLRPLVTPPKGAIDLLESFARTAPDRVTRTALVLASPIQKLNEWIKGGIGWLGRQAGKGFMALMAVFRMPDLKKVFKGRSPSFGKKVRPKDFRKHMKAQPFHEPEWEPKDYDNVFKFSKEAVKNAHFLKEHKADDLDALDACTKQVWEEVDPWKRLIFATVFPVLVVTAVVVSLAATLVDPTLVGGGIIVANLLEILSGSAIAYLVSSQGMVKLQKVMEKDLVIPQLNDLHATLCDRLGVPRADSATLASGKMRRKLRPDKSKLGHANPILDVLPHRLVRLDESKVEGLLNEINSKKKGEPS